LGRKNPRLQFTEEELPAKLKRHVHKAAKATDQADRAQAKLPKKRKMARKAKPEPPPENKTGKGGGANNPLPVAASPAPAGKSQKRLYFEEVDRPKPPSKLVHHAAAAPIHTLAGAVHREVQETEEDNVGVESAHKLEETSEMVGKLADHSIRTQKLKPYRNAEKAEKRLEQANLNALYQKALNDNPQLASHPLSRWQQKRAIKRQYAAAMRRTTEQTANGTRVTVQASSITDKAAHAVEQGSELIRRHKKGLGVVLALFLVVAMLLGIMSSCTALLEGGLSALSSSTYLSEDEDMLDTQDAYAAMEEDLQEYLDTYVATHSYNEYHFDLDTIEHDPYVLISILSALQPGFTLEEVTDTMETLFDQQYILTETVSSEIRYDEEGEPYLYTICNVKLENKDLSHLPVYIMDEDQLSAYATYMATLGNHPDLFSPEEYPGVNEREDVEDYDVPPEALSDERFAAMLTEAEKFLGYPYVWGGSKPSTSFDCSGYVSWVINHCGVGWNYGRRGAQALYNLCTPVSAANAKPGDLIFFTRTYNAPNPVSHVGIYVGNGKMIHCGDVRPDRTEVEVEERRTEKRPYPVR